MEDEAAAGLATRQVMARYHSLGDIGDNDGRARCFMPDGVLATALWIATGRQGIVERLKARALIPGRKPFVRHHLTTSLVEVHDKQVASGRSYFAVYSDIGLDHIGTYDDGFERIDGEWLIARRDVALDWKAAGSYVRQPVRGPSA